MMRKIISFAVVIGLLMTIAVSSFAEPIPSAVAELYSADGYYVDSVGNGASYSYHVPQITASSPAAEEINREIAERTGNWVESQLKNMKEGYSLWSWHAEWQAYWNGSQLFLLITQDTEGGFTDYSVYGYDFATQTRITNQMILKQQGISEEEYLENLKEKVQLMLEDMCRKLSKEQREEMGFDVLLEKTLSWADMEQPMFIDGFGEIETIVKIASIAGAEWYYHLATPFSYG